MSVCGSGCGINKERERERASALAAIELAYPGLVWAPLPRSLLDSSLKHSANSIDFDTISSLGRSLEGLLPVRAIARSGDDDGCDWLYLLAGVHSPALVQIADGLPLTPERARRIVRRETYVRIGFSPLGRFVTLQEVNVRSELLSESALEIVEEPLLGVEDRGLQSIIKALQGELRRRKLAVLDMAFLVSPAHTDMPQTTFEKAFESPPLLWSFLFEPSPPTTRRAQIVALTRRSRPIHISP